MSYFHQDTAAQLVADYASMHGLAEMADGRHCFRISDWDFEEQCEIVEILTDEAMNGRKVYNLVEIMANSCDDDTAVNLFNPNHLGPMLAKCALMFIGDELDAISDEACRLLDQGEAERRQEFIDNLRMDRRLA